jgi:ABC-type transport system involved in multi-copper enzyme maturation permease subunit
MPAQNEALSYIWKSWRDTRGLFFVLLAIALFNGAMIVYAALDPFGWPAADRQFFVEATLGVALVFLPFTGLLLGALGVGTEFERRTAEFLLTRPRPRRWFLWVNWAVGAAELLLVVLVMNLFRLAPLGSARFRVESWGGFIRPMVALWTLALVMYSVTNFMTTLARNSKNGTGLALAAFSVYVTAFLVLRKWFGIEIPFFEELIRASHTADGAALTTLAGWLAVALAFTLAAQFYFDRAEA